MNTNEVVTLLETGTVRIAFDTNVLFSDKTFFQICNQVNQINAARQYKLQLLVPVLAHAEKLYDLRQEYQDTYDFNFIRQGLEHKQVKIMSFEPHHADKVSELIAKSFPTQQAWYEFKRQRCISCLGLKKSYEGNASGKSCSATVDWLIAGYADAEDCLLITDDKGEEFCHIDCKTSLKSLKDALSRLLNNMPTIPLASPQSNS